MINKNKEIWKNDNRIRKGMDYQAWFKKANEGKSESEISKMNEMVQNTGKYRKIVKEQLWELVDKTEPALKGEAMK